MKKQIVTSLLTLVFLFTCCINCFAQDTGSIVIDDSSVSTIENGNFYPVTGDTVLRRIIFKPSHDSFTAYRSGRDFGYMQYLDSLLKLTKSLTIDTINPDNIKNQKKKARVRSKQSSGDSLFDTLFVRILFWTFAICFIVFILYNLFLTEGIFKRSPRRHIVPFQQQEEKMLNPGAYEKLITEALVNKDFRLAVRYLYLQTLQELRIAGFIHFTPDKTNYEYVKELSGKPHQNEFASLTLNYEYVWYGKFDIDQKIFDRLQKDFKQYHQKL